jgi:triosephosphate isomerase (TIM)
MLLKKQLVTALASVSRKGLARIIIAYEPIWAIGKDYKEAESSHDVYQMVIFIRKTLSELYSKQAALDCPIIYGGSVEPENAADLIQNGGVSGFLVGHASLKADAFNKIITATDA